MVVISYTKFINRITGDFTLDSSGDIILDADGTDIVLKDGGTSFGSFKRASSDFIIKSETSIKIFYSKELTMERP